MTDLVHLVCPHCNAVNRLPARRLDNHPSCGRCHQPLFTGEPLTPGSAEFERRLTREELPLLVDFWAPWCGPCRMMAPQFQQAAAELEPQVRLLKINTEEAPELAARFAIRSIPTLILFRDGRERARQAGAMQSGQIVAWTRQQL